MGGDDATFKRDLCSLNDEYFWAATRDQLNDPFEGAFELSSLHNQIAHIKKLLLSKSPADEISFNEVEKSLQEVLSFVDKSGIFSLSQSPTEELLWAHYGNSHKGFCIEFDLDRLVEFKKQQLHCVEVQYSNAPMAFVIDDFIGQQNVGGVVQKMLGAKSHPWSYESEMRVVTSSAGAHPYDFRAVKAIYFGLRMDENRQNEIMKNLAGRGIAYRKIENAQSTYKLTHRPVNDPFINAPRYKYTIGKIAEHAISIEYLKPELRKYADCIYKAAEIVRREPYCDLVDQVEFSPSRSTAEHPVIYVQYRRFDHKYVNKYVNHYLTIAEIEAQFASITDVQNQYAWHSVK